MVGIVESVGTEVTSVKPGDRVTVNVETFCGECFFCKKNANIQSPLDEGRKKILKKRPQQKVHRIKRCKQ